MNHTASVVYSILKMYCSVYSRIVIFGEELANVEGEILYLRYNLSHGEFEKFWEEILPPNSSEINTDALSSCILL